MTRRPSLGGLSSYLFVLACCEGLGRMLSLVLGVSKPMFVSGPGRGGGVPSGSEACGGGTARSLLRQLPGRALFPWPAAHTGLCGKGLGLGSTALRSV